MAGSNKATTNNSQSLCTFYHSVGEKKTNHSIRYLPASCIPMHPKVDQRFVTQWLEDPPWLEELGTIFPAISTICCSRHLKPPCFLAMLGHFKQDFWEIVFPWISPWFSHGFPMVFITLPWWVAPPASAASALWALRPATNASSWQNHR